MTAPDPLPEEDVRDDERFVIMVGQARNRFRRVAETSLNGIGSCLLTLREEGQITVADNVGILDRRAGLWLIFPGGTRRLRGAT